MKALKNQWVEIEQTLIKNRVARIPEDTKQVPLKSYIQGFIEEDAYEGDEVVIKTLINRKHTGILINSDPTFTHDFGKPIEELLSIGMELKKELKKGE